MPWKSYRVSIHAEGAEPLYTSATVVNYYSSWQLLQYAEVVNMGVVSFINLLAIAGWPSEGDFAAAPRAMSFKPVHAMRGFREHARTLDAIIWFAEEAHRGYCFATRDDHSRLVSAEEEQEITRTRTWAAEQAQKRHDIGPPQLLAAIRFLCGQWADWSRERRPLIAGAYKVVAAQGVRLACLATGMTADEYRDEVGKVGGYLKPILGVIWPDWAQEQREKARNILVGFRRETALLKAEFCDELVDQFLDFIETNGLQGLYWRIEWAHRHAFKGTTMLSRG